MKTVPLRGKKAAGRVALVDDADYEFVMQYKWYLWEGRDGRHGPYARTRFAHDEDAPQGGWRFMHNLIAGIKGVDHEDNNGLNNQRNNLREATPVQNGQNRRPNAQASSALKGVGWHKRDQVWTARIRVNGKLVHLGTFALELDAAYAYDVAARKYFGRFANPNFPESPENTGRAQEGILF